MQHASLAAGERKAGLQSVVHHGGEILRRRGTFGFVMGNNASIPQVSHAKAHVALQRAAASLSTGRVCGPLFERPGRYKVVARVATIYAACDANMSVADMLQRRPSRTRRHSLARTHRRTHPQVQAKEVKRVCEGRCGWLCKRGLQNTSLQRRWCGRVALPRKKIAVRVPLGSSKGTWPVLDLYKNLRRGRSDGTVPRNRCAIHDLSLYYFENPRSDEPKGVVNLRGLVRRCFLRPDVRAHACSSIMTRTSPSTTRSYC